MKPEDAHNLMDELAEEQRLEDAAFKAAEQAEEKRQRVGKERRVAQEQRRKAEHKIRREAEERRLRAEQQRFKVFERKLMAQEQPRKIEQELSIERIRTEDGRLTSRLPQTQQSRSPSIEPVSIQPVETPEIESAPTQRKAGPAGRSTTTSHTGSGKAENLRGLGLAQMMHENMRKSGCFPKLQKKKSRRETRPTGQTKRLFPSATLIERKGRLERMEADYQGLPCRQLVMQPMSGAPMPQQDKKPGPEVRPSSSRERQMLHSKSSSSLGRQEERARPEAAPGPSRTHQQEAYEIATEFPRTPQEDIFEGKTRARTPRTGREVSRGRVLDPPRGQATDHRAEQDKIHSWRRQQERLGVDTRAVSVQGGQETKSTWDSATRAAWSHRERVQRGGINPATKSLPLHRDRPETRAREAFAPSQLKEDPKAKVGTRPARKQQGTPTAQAAVNTSPRQQQIPTTRPRTGSLPRRQEQQEAESVIKSPMTPQERRIKDEQRRVAKERERLQERERVCATALRHIREDIADGQVDLEKSEEVLALNVRTVQATRRRLEASCLRQEIERKAAARPTPEKIPSRVEAAMSGQEGTIRE